MALTDAHKLALVRLAHTIIYVVNGAACFVILYAGLTGTGGLFLRISMELVGIEAVILAVNAARCPITPIAVRYGARETDFCFDTFLPERMTRYTIEFFSTIVLLGLLLMALRWAGILS